MEQIPQEIHEIINNYTDIDSVFYAMPEGLRRHSIRVAEYVLVLFESALRIEFKADDKESAEELNKRYKNYIYLVGKYHDIGVMVVPRSIREKRYDEMTREEKNIFELHPFYGEMLAEKFMVQHDGEPEVFWKMLMAGARCHNELPNGRGYPNHLTMNDVFVSTQLLILANMLDSYTSKIHTEDPFEEGYANMEKQLEETGLNELALTIRVAKNRLKKVFLAHRYETRMVIVPPGMVNTRGTRPLTLKYRPAVDLKTGQVIAIEANPRFYLSAKKEELEFEEVRSGLQKAKALPSVWKYFLYDAVDTAVKIEAYGFEGMKLWIPVFPSIASQAKTVTMIRECIKNTGIDPDRLCFMYEESSLKKPSNALLEALKRIKLIGCHLIVSDYEVEGGPEAIVLSAGFDNIRFSPTVLDRLDEVTVNYLSELKQIGIKVFTDGVDSGDYFEQLTRDGFDGATGKEIGSFVSEKEIISFCNSEKNDK